MADLNINQKINERAFLVKWATDTEQYLTRSIVHKKLIRSSRLEKSVTMNMMGITTQVRTFVFKYSLHGLFVDMGLFGGRSLDEKNDSKLLNSITGKRGARNKKLKNLPKRQYMWYSRTMYGAINVLGKGLLEIYGQQAVNAMKLPEIIEI